MYKPFSMSFYENTLTIDIYERWQAYCASIQNVSSFRQHPDLEYMLEHDCLPMYLPRWLEIISDYVKKYNLTDDQMQTLVSCNEKFGNSKKNARVYGVECNACTIRYIYMAFHIISQLDNFGITNPSIVEIGPGYGGLCVVFSTLTRILHRPVKGYYCVDLASVSNLQKKYVSSHEIEFPVHFVQSPNDVESTFSDVPPKSMFLFSSYSLSEMKKEVRCEYYITIFPKVSHGLLFWNTRTIDLPDYCNYNEQLEDPQTGYTNRIVSFTTN